MGWYTNDTVKVAQSDSIVGKSLVDAWLAKWTFPTVGQQQLRNLPCFPNCCALHGKRSDHEPFLRFIRNSVKNAFFSLFKKALRCFFDCHIIVVYWFNPENVFAKGITCLAMHGLENAQDSE